jgi:hypothetical protein
MHMLDQVQTEPELEVQEEYSDPQASSCVSANIVYEQGMIQVHPPQSFTFILNHYFMLSLIVH